MDASGSFHEKHAICCALIRRMETSHERVAQTRNHRVRGWNGSDELSPGRARPRVISAQSLGLCPATASAKVVVFAWTFCERGRPPVTLLVDKLNFWTCYGDNFARKCLTADQFSSTPSGFWSFRSVEDPWIPAICGMNWILSTEGEASRMDFATAISFAS